MRWDADAYDEVSEPQTRWGTVVLDRLELSGTEVVLDAGCGSGRVTEVLAERLPDGRAIGLDASSAMVLKTRERLGPRVPVVVAELGTGLPFGHASFDAVLSTATFHWVHDQRTLYAELGRVMRPGGRLVAQCGGKGNIASVLEAIRAAGGEALDGWVFLDADEAAALLRMNGFVDVETWLHPEPTRFGTVDELARFLSTCVLNPWLARLPDTEHERFANAVAGRLPSLETDYVRLNISARKGA